MSPVLMADTGAGAVTWAAADAATPSAASAGRAAPAVSMKAIRQSGIAETLLGCPVIFPVLSEAAAAAASVSLFCREEPISIPRAIRDGKCGIGQLSDKEKEIPGGAAGPEGPGIED